MGFHSQCPTGFQQFSGFRLIQVNFGAWTRDQENNTLKKGVPKHGFALSQILHYSAVFWYILFGFVCFFFLFVKKKNVLNI